MGDFKNKILLKRSDVAGHTPAVDSLSSGEIVVNTADGIIFLKKIVNSNEYIVKFLNSEEYPYLYLNSLSSIKAQYGNNTITQAYNLILGGTNNNILSGAGSTIINGESNIIDGDLSSILNGYQNIIEENASFSTILNGSNNKILSAANYSSILGGTGNTANHESTYILGDNITTNNKFFVYVNNLSSTADIYTGGRFLSGGQDILTILKPSIDLANEVYAAVKNISADWNSVYSYVKGSSSLELQTRTFVNNNSSNILNVNTKVNSTSANWDSVYSYTNTTSGLESSVRNFVNSNSGNLINVSSTVNNTSANWNSGYSYYNTNSSTYAKVDFVNSKFLPNSGGLVTGITTFNNNVTIYGVLSATGGTYFSNTYYTTTSALSVVHVGGGPALYVSQTGSGDIASFYDQDEGVEVLHIGGANGSFPNVGIKTSTPNVDFTVNGQISASGNIWTSGQILSGGQELLSIIQPNLNIGIETYSNIKSLTGNWNSVYSYTNANSSLELQTRTYVNNTTADWNSVYSQVNLMSGLELNVRSFVNSNSANLINVSTKVNNTSANWDSVYSFVNSNSAINSSNNTFVQNNSANILEVNTKVNTTSANWNIGYSYANITSSRELETSTFVGNNSANILEVNTKVNTASANWDSTYTTFKNSSSEFITQVNANYLPLSGGTINGNLYVTQTLSSAKTVYSEEFAYNSTERPDLTGVKQALDELLYTLPTFNSLTINGGNSLEVGQSINTPTVSWTTNKTFNSITLTYPNNTTSSGNGSFLSTSDPSSYTFSTTTGSKTWSVQGTDWKSSTANRSTTVNWYYKVYMGSFNTTVPTSTDVLTNAQHSALGSTRTTLGSKSITLSNEYFYVAYPAAFGTTSQLKVNGLNFTDLASVYIINPFTNSSGGTASYYVYRTNNKLTGTYTMEVL